MVFRLSYQNREKRLSLLSLISFTRKIQLHSVDLLDAGASGGGSGAAGADSRAADTDTCLEAGGLEVP